MGGPTSPSPVTPTTGRGFRQRVKALTIGQGVGRANLAMADHPDHWSGLFGGLLAAAGRGIDRPCPQTRPRPPKVPEPARFVPPAMVENSPTDEGLPRLWPIPQLSQPKRGGSVGGYARSGNCAAAERDHCRALPGPTQSLAATMAWSLDYGIGPRTRESDSRCFARRSRFALCLAL